MGPGASLGDSPGLSGTESEDALRVGRKRTLPAPDEWDALQLGEQGGPPSPTTVQGRVLEPTAHG